MKITIVGPTHPYKGGIAKHTTELAHKLAKAGHQVTLVSWRHQYPFFYPGQQFVPDDQPEVQVFENTRRVLSWRNPAGWAREGRRLRAYDQVIFVWWVPKIQGPVYTVMLRALGKGLKTTLLCHNVLRHEATNSDKIVVRRILQRISNVVVHSVAQADLARELGATEVIYHELPPVLPPRRHVKPPAKRELKHHLLFFGIVRHYKGLDVLLRALAKIPSIKLTVAGEIWGKDEYGPLAAELGIAERVHFLNRYVADSELEGLFRSADALVLPYRGGTATFNVAYAHYYHIPVIATRAASLATMVHDGVDGLLCEPDDVTDLTTTIHEFYKPGVAKQLQAGVPEVITDEEWAGYVSAVTGA